MGLVRIRHGVAQYAMKSRVRAYKNRAKGSGWQANWREHFCHSPTLKTSVFPLSIRLLFGPITSPTIKKSTSVADLDSNQEVGGGAKASGSRMFKWWSSGKKALRTRFIALYSLLSSHFEFLPDKAQEWLHCQIQVQISILSLLHHLPHFALPGRFGQSLNLLNRDSMACRTPVRKKGRLMVGGVLGRGSFLPHSFVFDFFLLNSTENFRVVASRPRKKKKPHSLGCFLVTDFTKTGQSSASGRSPARLWNASPRPRFFLTWTFPLPFLPDLSLHLTYSLLFYFSYMERVFCIVHCNFVYFSPLGDPSTRV